MENDINPEKKSSAKFYTSILLVVVVIVVGFLLLRNTTPPEKSVTSNTNTTFGDIGILPVTNKDHILGDPNAKIIIVEYSDTECPFCKRFHIDMHKLVDAYSDVAWVYRHYPIPSLHVKALNEALASECAAAQGGNDTFWRYIDEIYSRTNSNDSLDEQQLYAIASYLDLNTLAFKTCMVNKEQASIVEAHMADGTKNSVQGTPTSFVLQDGQMVQKIPGALPYEQLAPFIEDLLK